MTPIAREQLLFRLRERDALRKPGVLAFYERLKDRKYLPFGGKNPKRLINTTSDPEAKGILKRYVATGHIDAK